MRRKDAVLMAFLGGALCLIVFFTILLLSTPATDGYVFQALKLYASFPAFRFTLVLCIILAATGMNIKILKRYKVNYLFIFELDPSYKIT